MLGTFAAIGILSVVAAMFLIYGPQLRWRREVLERERLRREIK